MSVSQTKPVIHPGENFVSYDELHNILVKIVGGKVRWSSALPVGIHCFSIHVRYLQLPMDLGHGSEKKKVFSNLQAAWTGSNFVFKQSMIDQVDVFCSEWSQSIIDTVAQLLAEKFAFAQS